MNRTIRLDRGAVKRNFSCSATEYDRFALVQKRVVRRLIDLLGAEGCVAGGAVLEVGTGTGMLTDRLIRSFPEVRPVVSDLAHGMSVLAAERLPGVPALDADALALPVRDGALDMVLSSSVYQWVEDLPAAFGEAFRVLSPGGRFALALFAERTLWELRDAHRQAAQGAGLSSHVQEFHAESEIFQALESAGFSDIRLVSGEEVEMHPDVPSLLRALKRIGAGNAAQGRPGGLASRRVMQKMIEIYERSHRRNGSIPATYHVVYAVASRRGGRELRGAVEGEGDQIA